MYLREIQMLNDTDSHLNLYGTGWLTDWKDVVGILADATCTWVDLTGTQLTMCPATAPVTTHLWAWRDADLFRVRIDDGRSIVARLAPDAPANSETVVRANGSSNGSDLFRDHESVPVTTHPSQTWGESHVRVGQLKNMTWEVVQVLSGSAMTFLRPRPSD